MQAEESYNLRKLAFTGALMAPSVLKRAGGALRHTLDTIAIVGGAIDTLSTHAIAAGQWIVDHTLRSNPTATVGILAGAVVVAGVVWVIGRR